jgi:hypothetical protein
MLCRFAAVRGAGEAAGAIDARLAGAGASFCTVSGFAKMPCIGLQVKYLLPFTDPSFFPFGNASSIPTQTPDANSGMPTKRTTPRPCAWLTLSPSTTLADAIDMSSWEQESAFVVDGWVVVVVGWGCFVMQQSGVRQEFGACKET